MLYPLLRRLSFVGGILTVSRDNWQTQELEHSNKELGLEYGSSMLEPNRIEHREVMTRFILNIIKKRSVCLFLWRRLHFILN